MLEEKHSLAGITAEWTYTVDISHRGVITSSCMKCSCMVKDSACANTLSACSRLTSFSTSSSPDNLAKPVWEMLRKRRSKAGGRSPASGQVKSQIEKKKQTMLNSSSRPNKQSFLFCTVTDGPQPSPVSLPLISHCLASSPLPPD